MSSKPNRNIIAEVTQSEMMSLYEGGSLGFRERLGERVKKEYTKFYYTRMKIIMGLLAKDKCVSDIDALMIRPLPSMAGFDIALEFKGRDIMMHIVSQKKWKDIKTDIEKAKANITDIQEGKLGRCPVCYEDLKDAETTYGCAVCSVTLCMCCVDGLRKDKTIFKCPTCRTINNCSHLLN
jgi:hypothetical protein